MKHLPTTGTSLKKKHREESRRFYFAFAYDPRKLLLRRDALLEI